MVLHIEPLLVPPLVRRRSLHRDVLPRPVALKVDAGAPHRHWELSRVVSPLLGPLIKSDHEEVLPEGEVGLDPQISLAQCDKHHDVLDAIGVEVL